MITVEAGPFNGPDDADSAMTWVDITAYVNDNLQPPTTAVGRQTELQQVNPGAFSLVLNNQDHRFTPANPTSPYFPGWRTGMRIRMRETLGYQTFLHFDGNMLQPDVTIQVPDADQTVTVNATDRLGRLQQSRAFISTLAEYILFNGGTALQAYYPLGESRAPFRSAVGTQGSLSPYFSASASSAQTLLTLANQIIAPGDDLLAPLWTPQMVVGGGGISASTAQLFLRGSIKPAITLSTGQTLTVVAWLNPTNVEAHSFVVELSSTTSLDDLYVRRTDATESPPGVWKAKLWNTGGAWDITAFGDSWGFGRPNIVAAQFTLGTAGLLLTNTSSFAAVVTGSPSASMTFDTITLGGDYTGAINHVQIYLDSGSPTYTSTAQAAQMAAGLTGLANQYTGQRVSTVAQYAGVAVGDMELDGGTSRMQKATLAGRSPLDVVQEAATTEQGLLHAAGRRLLFHDRLRRYNR